ncbi:UNVERIFIED_CONTAM: hypothetical protein Sradi_2221700 [Sesamum radiatum]|uniref:U3 small nucleolar RNA-associated protein 6 homolog C-terminal domain-containing protein n=1 Tax=Sesamum radiatum TaxID=300843 RepID=A0AAW2T2B3_SESRA
MKKALAQLVRFHPKVPGVWIYAAAWEFDNNLNVAAARALMQNGLRACPTSEDLWVEYLRMELTYLNKLKARKVALGEDEGDLARDHRKDDEKQWRDENKELFMALNESGDADKSNLQDGECEGKLDVFREHGLNILQAVYSGAIEALPTSFSVRTRFLEILEATDLAHSEDMRKKILEDMKRDFSKEPLYWDWLARVEIADLEGINAKQFSKAVQVYEEGMKFVPSAAMVELYVKFLVDAISDEDRGGEAAVHLKSHGHTTELVSHLQMVYEKAESLGCITEELACQHVSFLLQLGKLDEAKLLIEKLCSGKFSEAVRLWTLRLSIEMRCIQNKFLSPSKADFLYILELLRSILMKVRVSEAENLWIMMVEVIVGFHSHQQLSIIFFKGDGVESAREMYKRFLALPHPGLAIYRNCIEIELNLASTGEKTGLPKARKLYESALATYDQDASLWQDYHSMEVKMGTSETAAAVHWRARKALKDNTSLLPSATS